MTFAGVVSFLRGAANGTRTPSTQNLTMCEKKVTVKWDLNARKIVN